MIEGLNGESIKEGVKTNMAKTKIMLNSLAKQKEFKIENHTLECIQECVYLGQLLTGEPNRKKKSTKEYEWAGAHSAGTSNMVRKSLTVIKAKSIQPLRTASSNIRG